MKSKHIAQIAVQWWLIAVGDIPGRSQAPLRANPPPITRRRLDWKQLMTCTSKSECRRVSNVTCHPPLQPHPTQQKGKSGEAPNDLSHESDTQLWVMLGNNTMNTAKYTSRSISIFKTITFLRFSQNHCVPYMLHNYVVATWRNYEYTFTILPSYISSPRVVLAPQSIISNWGEPLTFRKTTITYCITFSFSSLSRLPFYRLPPVCVTSSSNEHWAMRPAQASKSCRSEREDLILSIHKCSTDLADKATANHQLAVEAHSMGARAARVARTAQSNAKNRNAGLPLPGRGTLFIYPPSCRE